MGLIFFTLFRLMNIVLDNSPKEYGVLLKQENKGTSPEAL